MSSSKIALAPADALPALQARLTSPDQHDAVVSAVADLCRTHPLDTSLLTRAAKMLETLGKAELAETLLGEGEAALKAANRKLGAVSVKRGQILIGMGRHEDALAAMERALNDNPKDQSAILTKAECLAALGRASEGLAYLEKRRGGLPKTFIDPAIERYKAAYSGTVQPVQKAAAQPSASPKFKGVAADPKVVARIGEIAKKANPEIESSRQAARDELCAYASQFTKDISLRTRIARLLFKFKYPIEAFDLLLNVGPEIRNHDQIQLTLADLYREQGQPARAIGAYDIILAKAPLHAQAIEGKAHAMAEKGDVRGAKSYFDERCTAVNTAAMTMCYSAFLRRYGFKAEREKTAARAAAQDPGNKSAVLQQIRKLRDAKRYDAAIEMCDKLISRDPDNHEAYTHKGILFDMKGERSAAVACYDAALAVNPSYTPALEMRLYTLMERTNWEGAKAFLARGRAGGADNSYITYLEARVMFHMGSFREAASHIFPVMQKQPSVVAICLFLAAAEEDDPRRVVLSAALEGEAGVMYGHYPKLAAASEEWRRHYRAVRYTPEVEDTVKLKYGGGSVWNSPYRMMGVDTAAILQMADLPEGMRRRVAGNRAVRNSVRIPAERPSDLSRQRPA